MPKYEEFKRKKVVLDFGAGDSVKSQDIRIAGEVLKLNLILSKSSGATSTTGTLSLEDVDAYEIYVDSTPRAIPGNYNLAERRFVAEKTTVKVTLDAPPGATKTAQAVVVVFYKGHEDN